MRWRAVRARAGRAPDLHLDRGRRSRSRSRTTATRSRARRRSRTSGIPFTIIRVDAVPRVRHPSCSTASAACRSRWRCRSRRRPSTCPEVAERLAELVDAGPAGRVADLGGPRATHRQADGARSGSRRTASGARSGRCACRARPCALPEGHHMPGLPGAGHDDVRRLPEARGRRDDPGLRDPALGRPARDRHRQPAGRPVRRAVPRPPARPARSRDHRHRHRIRRRHHARRAARRDPGGAGQQLVPAGRDRLGARRHAARADLPPPPAPHHRARRPDHRPVRRDRHDQGTLARACPRSRRSSSA